MPASVESHSHRSTTKVSHKPFKSRKATKGTLKEIAKGKIQDLSHRKTPHQHLMSKFERRNQARQKQQTKHREHLKETNIFAGRDRAPRTVAVIPLCADGNAIEVVTAINGSLDIETKLDNANTLGFQSTLQQGLIRTDVNRFKQKIQYVVVQRDLFAALDAARTADFVIFLLSPERQGDEIGELILRSVQSQGLSTLITVVKGLDKIEPPKKRPQMLSYLKFYISHFHPEQEKVHNLDSREECANLMRSLCTMTPRGVRWRDERSWMIIEEVKWPGNTQENVVLTGIVRGKSLKADRLVHINDWGDFQIEKILEAPFAAKRRPLNEMIVENTELEKVLDTPTADQDDLAELAPENISMEDHDGAAMSIATIDKRGVLLDDHHYFSEDETHVPAIPKRLPKGTSAYQSAWFLGDTFSDSGSDLEDVDEQGDIGMKTAPLPQDGTEGFAPREPTEFAPTEYPQSEMFLDPNPEDEVEAKQLAAFRGRKGDEAEEDREFPDEIELHPQVLARERLARYRGLKSLRTSPWEEEEDRVHEPEDWRRYLQVPDYKSARNQVNREALVGGVPAGKRVHIYLRNVPLSLRSAHDPSRPLNLFSLLRHEHKRAVVNFSITLNSDHPSPIKSKEELLMQCGPRRFVISPLFSQGAKTPNDVHKFDRFLHPGGSAVATFVAPLTWGSVPTLFFKRSSLDVESSSPDSAPSLTLIATGTSLPPSSSRVIAKRIILTGHPFKIHKKLVTIRYMFFNREDVEWFKALQLWTKRGRSGFIKESLGTHGYFKATFDGKINPQDSVGVSLYKRVWPRSAKPWDPRYKLAETEEQQDVPMEVIDSEGRTGLVF